MGKAFRKFRYHLYIGLTIVGVIVMGGLIFREACIAEPPAEIVIGVSSEDFSEPTRAAMDIMNGFVDCEFLVPGDDVLIVSADGEPCGKPFHPNNHEGEGHSAGAYQCSKTDPNFRGYEYEIHVSAPGDLRTQVCIAAHELGHVAGLPDKPSKQARGIMNQHVCPERQIVLSDDEVSFLRKKFCK